MHLPSRSRRCHRPSCHKMPKPLLPNALKLLAPKATLPQGVNYAIKSTRLLLLLEEHIPGAGEKLRESFPRTARDPASIRAEVGRATVLILVDRGRL